jgi:hypothetical protein
MDKRPRRHRNRPGHYWEQKNLFPMPRNEGFLGLTARGLVTRWSKAECSQDRDTPCLPVWHPKPLDGENWIRYMTSTLKFVWEVWSISLYTSASTHPYIHTWSYIAFWAFVSLKRCLYSSLTPACLLHPCTHRTRNASLQTSPGLALRFSPDFVLCYTFVYRAWNPTSWASQKWKSLFIQSQCDLHESFFSWRCTWVLVADYDLEAKAVKSWCTRWGMKTELSPTVGTRHVQ